MIRGDGGPGSRPRPPARRPLLTRQTKTAIVAAGTFIALAMGLAFTPVPYVIYTPGRAYDVLGVDDAQRPILEISGAPTYADPGKLSMTTVSITRADASATLPEALAAKLLPNRDALPRDSVYPSGQSSEQIRSEEKRRMDSSQQDAIVAALRAANQPVEEWPVVAQVTVSGPSNTRLRPGDLILAVDGQTTRTWRDVQTRVATHTAGDTINFTVWRDRAEVPVSVTSVGRHGDPKTATIGVDLSTGYRYPQVIHFGISNDIGGPSAGLIFALGAYERLTPGALLNGRNVAGTGTIDARGTVGGIGGIQEKIAGAEASGATIFLVPGENCRDLRGVHTKMELIRADTLASTIEGLRASADPAQSSRVPRC